MAAAPSRPRPNGVAPLSRPLPPPPQAARHRIYSAAVARKMRTQALRCALVAVVLLTASAGYAQAPVTRSSPRAPIVAGKMLHALALLYLDATVDGERAGAGPLAPRIVAAERRSSIVLRPHPNQRRHTVTLTVPKHIHEIRDPIHTFVRLDSYERAVLDSGPFQRLRHIHQLALTYLVYPGATHKRFEHSLGVMELASRVFDIVIKPTNVTDPMIRHRLPQLDQEDDLRYWRRSTAYGGALPRRRPPPLFPRRRERPPATGLGPRAYYARAYH